MTSSTDGSEYGRKRWPMVAKMVPVVSAVSPPSGSLFPLPRKIAGCSMGVQLSDTRQLGT